VHPGHLMREAIACHQMREAIACHQMRIQVTEQALE